MLVTLNTLFAQFTALYKANPIVAGMIGLWGATGVTFLLRGVPTAIWNVLERQLTTTLSLNSQDTAYYDFLNWVTKNKLHSFVRTLNLNNGKFGYSRDKSVLSIGYGRSYFTFNGRLFWLSRESIKEGSSDYIKEQIHITMLGRKHKTLLALVQEIAKVDETADYTEIWTWAEHGWELTCKQFKRPLDTISLNIGVKEKLIKHLDDFTSNKNWYLDNGIGYKTGILLKGPPGTGKTSIIRGLCAHYNKNLYLLPIGGLTDRGFQAALSSVPEGAVVAIEDIDGYGVDLKRKKNNKSTQSTTNLSISAILNAIDGAMSSENRILIATTNHPEKLDKALLRSGRFDLKVEIGYMDTKSFKDYMKRFYPKLVIPLSFKIKSKISPCDIQQLIFDNMDKPEEVIKKVWK